MRRGEQGTDPPKRILLGTSVKCLPGSIDPAIVVTTEISSSIKCRGPEADRSEDW